MAKAIQSQGVVLYVTDGGSPTEYTAIPNVTDFSGPGGQASVIDISNLDSLAREKMMGLADEGQLTFNLNWDPDSTVHQRLNTLRKNRTKAEFKIALTDATPTNATFFGYVLGVQLTAGVDAAVKAAVTVEIDGPVTWA